MANDPLGQYNAALSDVLYPPENAVVRETASSLLEKMLHARLVFCCDTLTLSKVPKLALNEMN